MKQEWWKKKLREDAELHFPDSEKNGNEPYRQPDSAQFLPRKIQPRMIAQYGAATAETPAGSRTGAGSRSHCNNYKAGA